jgi:hypothetical protein
MTGSLFQDSFTSIWHFPQPQTPEPSRKMIILLEVFPDGTITMTKEGKLPACRSHMPCNGCMLHPVMRSEIFWSIDQWQNLGHTWQRGEHYDVLVGIGHPKTRDQYDAIAMTELRQKPQSSPFIDEVMTLIRQTPEWRTHLASQGSFFGDENLPS